MSFFSGSMIVQQSMSLQRCRSPLQACMFAFSPYVEEKDRSRKRRSDDLENLPSTPLRMRCTSGQAGPFPSRSQSDPISVSPPQHNSPSVTFSRETFRMRRSVSIDKGLDLLCSLEVSTLSEVLDKKNLGTGTQDLSIMARSRIGTLRDGEWVILAH
mmetsp:Transcript_45611/g.74352  ORF Transcript_45611/g.74352 Transcript_45611/m.74352 type:complete len:157 (-) Transcript_45611:972-1442(-)